MEPLHHWTDLYAERVLIREELHTYGIACEECASNITRVCLSTIDAYCHQLNVPFQKHTDGTYSGQNDASVGREAPAV